MNPRHNNHRARSYPTQLESYRERLGRLLVTTHQHDTACSRPSAKVPGHLPSVEVGHPQPASHLNGLNPLKSGTANRAKHLCGSRNNITGNLPGSRKRAICPSTLAALFRKPITFSAYRQPARYSPEPNRSRLLSPHPLYANLALPSSSSLKSCIPVNLRPSSFAQLQQRHRSKHPVGLPPGPCVFRASIGPRLTLPSLVVTLEPQDAVRGGKRNFAETRLGRGRMGRREHTLPLQPTSSLRPIRLLPTRSPTPFCPQDPAFYQASQDSRQQYIHHNHFPGGPKTSFATATTSTRQHEL